MPVTRAQRRLQRIVPGDADALELVDHAEVRELLKEGPRLLLIREASRIRPVDETAQDRGLVDVPHDVETPSLRPDVSDLHNRIAAQRLFDVDVVAGHVRRFEVRADRKQVDHVVPGYRDVRRKNGLVRHDGVGVPRNLVHRLRARRVRLDADRPVVRERRLIEERRNRRRIVEDSEAAAHDEVVAPVRLIGETDTRAEVLPRSRIEVLNLLSDNDESSTARIERREILLTVVHRSLEVPPETEVDVQLAAHPPRVLREQVE